MSQLRAASTFGFTDMVSESQASFRTVMDAFSYPALAQDFSARASAWGAMPATMVTLLLTLVDQDTAIWLDKPYSEDDELRACIAFYCGAPIFAEPARAAFAFISDAARIGDFAQFAQGDPDFPDRSTTLVVQTGGLESGPHMFSGPGVREPRAFGADGLVADFSAQWRMNRRSFPLGVDLIFVTDAKIVALPRSLRLLEV
jgi:alpha-D-ribose 1-methylphosphonate 5-triphosphate synthase subunit PhnH